MDAVEPAAEALQHVNLMHGTKWYGNHRTTRLISPISCAGAMLPGPGVRMPGG